MTTWTDDEVGGTVWSEDEAAGTALGAATGSSLVGFVQSGTAQTDTVQNRLRQTISVLDYIPPALHDAIKAGTNTTDLASYVVLAVAAATGKTLLWPAGYYYIAAARTEVTTSQLWRGDGEGVTEIEWAAAPASGDSVNLEVYGPSLSSISQDPNSVAIGDATVVFGADPGTLTGLLVLRDSANSSFSGFRTDYKAGEIVEVASQVTATITLKSRTLGAYTASSTFDAFSYSPIVFQIEGIKCTFPSGVNLGMRMRRVTDWRIENCEFVGAALETVELGEYCYNGRAINSKAYNNATAASDQYGWALGGVQDADFIGCYGRASRHALSMGGSAIPNRAIRVTGGKFELTSEAQGLAAIDCHGNSEWVEFVGVQAEGAMLAGDNIKWSGGQIFGRGYGIGLREMLGSSFEIEGVDIKTYFANPNSSRGNGVSFESGATSANTTRGGHLRIRNNTIVYAGSSARPGIYLVYETGFVLGATTDVTVDGNEVRLTTAQATAVEVKGLATVAGSLRSIRCVRNPGVRNGGFDLRFATAIWCDDNDQSGGTDVGALIRNLSTLATDQVAYVRRNRFSACAFAGVRIQGDTSNKFVQVKVQDNDFDAVCATNQGAQANEAPIVASDVTTLLVERNTAPSAGANQTYDLSLTSTVDTAIVRDNRGTKNDVLILPAALLQDGNSWQGDEGGVPTVNTTAVGNVGGGTDTLMTASMRTGTWARPKSGIRITGWGTTANTAATKTVTLVAGSSTILTTALTTNQAGKWFVEAIVLSTGTDTQDYVSKLNEYGATAQTDCENGSLTLNDGGPLSVSFTGTATNNDDIVQEGMVIEPLR